MIDFDTETKQPSAVVENKSSLTTLSNYNSLQKSSSSLPKRGALNTKPRLKTMIKWSSNAQSSDKLI